VPDRTAAVSQFVVPACGGRNTGGAGWSRRSSRKKTRHHCCICCLHRLNQACCLTLRCSRPATAGFASLRRRLSSNVSPHMPTPVYLDNCIVSGEARGDLSPPSELSAVSVLRALEAAGRIDLFTSRLTWHEQGHTKQPLIRAQLEAARGNTSTVPVDTKHLGGRMQAIHGGGFISVPMLTDILDSALYNDVRSLGLKDIDARHLVHAHVNNCAWFVTTDPDFTAITAMLEARCHGFRIAVPSLAAAELSA
jgi:hypothetical protein